MHYTFHSLSLSSSSLLSYEYIDSRVEAAKRARVGMSNERIFYYSIFYSLFFIIFIFISPVVYYITFHHKNVRKVVCLFVSEGKGDHTRTYPESQHSVRLFCHFLSIASILIHFFRFDSIAGPERERERNGP